MAPLANWTFVPQDLESRKEHARTEESNDTNNSNSDTNNSNSNTNSGAFFFLAVVPCLGYHCVHHQHHHLG